MSPEEKQLKERVQAKAAKLMSWIAGLSFGAIFGLIFLALSAVAIFSQTETFQTWLRDRVVEAAQDNLDIEIDYQSAELKVFRFFPELNFYGVQLKDQKSDIEAQIDRIGISISAILSLPMLLWNKVYISEARVEGLSYQLSDLAVLEDWKGRLKPKESEGGSFAMQTIVHRISFRDFTLGVDVELEKGPVERLQAELRLDRFNVRIDEKRTRFEGEFSFSRIDLGPYLFQEGTASISDSVLEDSILRLGQFQLQTSEDFFQVSGKLNLAEEPQLDVRASVRVRLENYVKREGLSGEILSEAQLKGTFASLEAEGRLEGRQIYWRDRTWQNLKASWEFDSRRLNISPLEWQQGGERGRLNAELDLQDQSRSQWSLSLVKAPFGEYLGMADPDTRNYGGLVDLEISGRGVPLLSPVQNFQLKGAVEDLRIANSDGSSVYSTEGERVELDFQGSSDQADRFQMRGIVRASFAEIPADLELTRETIDLRVQAELDAPEAGSLFQFSLGAQGDIGLRLQGPLRRPRLELSPDLRLLRLSDMKFEEVGGKFVVIGRELFAEDLRSNTLSLNGGLQLRPKMPGLFENLRFQLSGADLDQIVTSIAPNLKEQAYRARGLASGAGQLNGPINRPTGVGEIAIQDFSLLDDRVRGRQFQSSWRFEDGELQLSNMIVRASRDGGLLQGGLSILPERGLGDMNIKGSQVRLADWFSLFDLGLPFQAVSDFQFEHSIEDSRVSLKANLKDTSIAASRLGDSEFDIRSERGLLSGDFKLIDEQILGKISSSSAEASRVDLRVSNLEVPSLVRVLQNSNLRLNLRGTGQCQIQAAPRRTEQTELVYALNSIKGSACEIQMRESRVLRGNVELHRIEEFRLSLKKDSPESVWAVRVPELNIRTGQRLLRLSGQFSNPKDFRWTLAGEGALDTASYFLNFLNRSSGLLRVDGVWDPKGFHGSVELDDGVLFFQDSPIVVRSGTARLRAENSRFELRTLTGQFRDGELRASGWFQLNQMEVESADIEINMNGPLIEPQTGFRFRLEGSLQLTIDQEDALLAGDLELYEGSFRRRLNLRTDLLRAFQPRETEYRFFEQQESFVDRWRLNIGLVSSEPFVVRNNIAEGEVDLNLRVLGRVGDPNLQGSLSVQRGRFSYFNRTFDILSGAIQFTDPQSNIPRYDIRAQTQVDQYVVAINVAGNADEQRVVYSSDPPLSEREILALVSYGTPPQAPDEVRDEDFSTQAAYAGISFVTGQLQDTLEGALSSDFGIQRFQLYPAFFDETGRTELQLKVGTDLIRNRLELNYFNFVTAEGGHQVELDFRVNRSISLVGGWREVRQGRDQSNVSGDFGGDIIFRFEFD